MQGRYALFVLSESVDSQKPNAQRQFGVGENRPSGYGRLMMAAMTLIAVTAAQLTVRVIATLRAGKAIGPAQFEQRLVTLRFGAIAQEKIGQTQAFLKRMEFFATAISLVLRMFYDSRTEPFMAEFHW